MARRGRKRKTDQRSNRQRETLDFARRDPLLDLLAFPRPSPVVSDVRPLDLSEVSDDRRWDPAPDRRFSTMSGGPARVVARTSVAGREPDGVTHGLDFDDAKRVLVCVRRTIRKEVLFAKRKTGKGSRAKRRRMKDSSQFKC